MPLIKTGTSLVPDMKFGWKPEVKCSHPPIPLYFDFIQPLLYIYNLDNQEYNNNNQNPTDIIVYKSKIFIDTY